GVGPRRKHGLLLPARGPLRHTGRIAPFDLARVVRERRGGARPAARALRHHRRGRALDGRHSRAALGPPAPRERSGALALRTDPQARWLVDALVLEAPAIRAPLPGPARVRSFRARALRAQGRARARAGGFEHAVRRRPGRHLLDADALLRQL